DNTWLSPIPVRWDMRKVLTVSTVLGVVGVSQTFLLLIIAKNHFHVSLEELQTIIFLKLAIAGHLTLLITRTRSFFLLSPFPAPILLFAIISTQTVSTLIAGMGWFVTPISWEYVGLIWVYCLVWVFINDSVKLLVYRHLEHRTRRHSHFLGNLKESLHNYNTKHKRFQNLP
ncbi:MAG: metal-transporting ATPase, partial [Methylococcaceae bacterium]